MKTLLVVAELSEAYGRTDMTKLIIAFRSFANAPQNETFPPAFSPHYNQSRDSLYFPSFYGIAVLLPLLRKLWETSDVSPVADQ